MLDDGSQTTLCSESLIQRLNVKTRPAALTLITLSGETEVQNSRMLDLSVRGISTTENVPLKDVRTVKHLPIDTKRRCSPELYYSATSPRTHSQNTGRLSRRIYR